MIPNNLGQSEPIVRVRGAKVTADLNPNNGLKILPVVGPPCFPLERQGSHCLLDCFLRWFPNMSLC